MKTLTATDQIALIAQLQAQLAHLQQAQTQRPNILLLSDAYKYSHAKFYEPGTTCIYSYLESRGHRGGVFEGTLVAGYQYLLKKYLSGPLFTQEELDYAADHLRGVFGRDDVFDKARFQQWLDEYDAVAPVRIRAVPEGTVVGTRNVLMTIENLDDRYFWLPNFLETLLLQVWYPITVATLSREVKKVVQHYFNLTSDSTTLDFQLNDFGFRGVSSVESAQIGGMAHLISWLGSDNTTAAEMIRRYYNTQEVFAKSIPATEHSIMTQGGEDGEFDVIRRVLRTYNTGPVACVCDSFNILRAVRYIGTELKDEVLARQGTLVIRPDSGDIIKTLEAIFDILFECFGYTLSSKGYKALPPQVRVIQGDGVNYDSIKHMYEVLAARGIAAENLLLGMGGRLLQAGIDRDTFNFAFKASYTEVNGQGRDVVKSPTELDAEGNVQKSTKVSKKGRLKLVKTADGYRTLTSGDAGFAEAHDELVTVYEWGRMVQESTFEEIRERARL
jgi:nicotinamide phosphoribosyltransferase